MRVPSLKAWGDFPENSWLVSEMLRWGGKHVRVAGRTWECRGLSFRESKRFQLGNLPWQFLSEELREKQLLIEKLMSGDLRQLLSLQGVPSSRVNTMKAHQPCPDAGASLPMRESAAFQLLSWEALCARDRIEWNVQILPGRGPWNRTFQRGSRKGLAEIKPTGWSWAFRNRSACRALAGVRGQRGGPSLMSNHTASEKGEAECPTPASPTVRLFHLVYTLGYWFQLHKMVPLL